MIKVTLKISILILTIVFTSVSCERQKKPNQQSSINISQELDTFDISTFEKNKVVNEYTYTLSNGDKVTQLDLIDIYNEKTFKKNSKYVNSKTFYKSGKQQGKAMLYNDLIIGKFIKYNEQGKIIEERDFDKYYDFTLEDVLKYCQENNLVEKNIPGFNKKAKVTLARTDSSNLTENDSIYWNIMYGPVAYTPKGYTQIYGAVLLYVLDGKTGKEIERKYKRIKIDKEWQPIED